jgi:hypothetical protein
VSNLLYLVIAVVLSILGTLWVWWRNRQPRSIDSGIRQFERELRALSPDPHDPRERRTG